MGAIKQEFSDVFPDFLSWIKKCVTEAEEAAEKIFYPGMIVCDLVTVQVLGFL